MAGKYTKFPFGIFSGTVKFPLADNTVANQVLQTDGSGNLSFATPGTGGISALTGDVTASGTGSVAATLATVNSNVGTFTAITLNGKGLATAGVNLALTGDITGTASGSGLATTLATVNANVGTFQGIVVNAKGLVTGATNQSYLTAVSGDSTPSLGGNLSVATHSLVSTSNGNIVLAPNGTGRVLIGSIEFSQKLTFTIADNQSSAATIFSWVAASYNMLVVEYVVVKNSVTEYGTLHMASQSTTADMTQTMGSIGTGLSGVVFDCSQSAGNNSLTYTSTSTGSAGSMTYRIEQF